MSNFNRKNKNLRSTNYFYHSQETEFKSGEDEIKVKDKDLQNKLTSFCQFLQEN